MRFKVILLFGFLFNTVVVIAQPYQFVLNGKINNTLINKIDIGSVAQSTFKVTDIKINSLGNSFEIKGILYNPQFIYLYLDANDSRSHISFDFFIDTGYQHLSITRNTQTFKVDKVYYSKIQEEYIHQFLSLYKKLDNAIELNRHKMDSIKTTDNIRDLEERNRSLHIQKDHLIQQYALINSNSFLSLRLIYYDIIHWRDMRAMEKYLIT